MRAVILGDDGQECFADIPEPTPAPGEVIVEIAYCGVCGSDLHAEHQGFRHGVALGHEFSGRIIETGTGGVADFVVGDRVCINPNGDWCGSCGLCRAGQYNLCANLFQASIGVSRHGGMARYVAVPAKVLHRLPDGVTTKQGAWVEPLATALRGVRKSGIAMGDSAFVFGGGPIGLLVIALLRSMGAGHITTFEPGPGRAAMASRLGADDVLNPFNIDLTEIYPDPATAPAYGFECSGVAAATESALQLLRPSGILTVTGIAPKLSHYQATDLVFKETTIQGSFIYDEEFAMAIDLLDRGVIDIEPLTSEIRSMNGGLQAFADLRQADQLIKVLLTP